MATALDFNSARQTDALRASEESFRGIVDVIPQCINVMDAEGKVLYANRMLVEYSGRSLEELKGSDFPVMNSLRKMPKDCGMNAKRDLPVVFLLN